MIKDIYIQIYHILSSKQVSKSPEVRRVGVADGAGAVNHEHNVNLVGVVCN